MTHMTTLIAAEATRLIRPFDSDSHTALQRLARVFDARIEPGALALAGQTHPALLAVTPSGAIIAAVLLGDDGEGGAASLTPSTTPTTTERALCAQEDSQEA